jgi:alpha-glucosidase (family GH31 glycosyl hydrolase)
MVGDRLLVAPLFAGEPERKVILPEGEWQNFWSGEVIKSRTHTVPSTVPVIPVYVKAGSLIPWADIAQHTEAAEARRITVRVYGDGRSTWSSLASVGGLQLRWDSQAHRGTVTQQSGKDRPFDVVGWQKIG